jgi:hypothetical protein
MDITQDNVKMLDPGDFDKLDKREKEAFHALQEEIASLVHKHCNHFKIQHPGLRIDWRFQAEVYQSVLNGPSSVRYSDRIF